jgi:hypothetical protein
MLLHTPPRSHITAHEAGHGAAALALGCRFATLELVDPDEWEDDGGVAGHLTSLEHVLPDPPSDPEMMGTWLDEQAWRSTLDGAIVTRAGAAATGEDWLGLGPSSDRAAVRRHGEIAGWDPNEFESLVEELCGILVRSKVFDKIYRPLVVALDREKRLSYADCVVLLGDRIPSGVR